MDDYAAFGYWQSLSIAFERKITGTPAIKNSLLNVLRRVFYAAGGDADAYSHALATLNAWAATQ